MVENQKMGAGSGGQHVGEGRREGEQHSPLGSLGFFWRGGREAWRRTEATVSPHVRAPVASETLQENLPPTSPTPPGCHSVRTFVLTSPLSCHLPKKGLLRWWTEMENQRSLIPQTPHIQLSRFYSRAAKSGVVWGSPF